MRCPDVQALIVTTTTSTVILRLDCPPGPNAIQVFPDTKQVELERVVPYALQLSWKPQLMVFNPALQHVGVEGITFEHQWERCAHSSWHFIATLTHWVPFTMLCAA